jgi:uncharacterized protein
MKLRAVLIVALCAAAPAAWAQAPARQSQPAQSTVPEQPAPRGEQAPPAASEKVDAAKAAAIRHLMDLTETSKLGDNVAAYFANRVRSVMSQSLSSERLTPFMDTFTKKFAEKLPSDAITNAVIPIYSRYFSMEDIQGLITFYESPLGQRVVKLLPQVERDTQNMSLDMGNKAALEVLQGMTDDYPELKPMLQPRNEPGAGAGPGATPGTPGTPPPATPPK